MRLGAAGIGSVMRYWCSTAKDGARTPASLATSCPPHAASVDQQVAGEFAAVGAAKGPGPELRDPARGGRGAAALAPVDRQPGALQPHLDRHLPRPAGQRAVLGGVGGQFMED